MRINSYTHLHTHKHLFIFHGFITIYRQTTRQFTAPPNSGIKHLEYLNPDPDDIISTYYPRAFDKSLDEVLVQEIQKAVNLKKEVAGLVYCYNKICKVCN